MLRQRSGLDFADKSHKGAVYPQSENRGAADTPDKHVMEISRVKELAQSIYNLEQQHRDNKPRINGD